MTGTPRFGCTHAAEAAADRYGIALGQEDFEATVRDIIDTVAGERRAALLLGRQRLGREIWLVSCPDGPALRVAYAPGSAVIVTVLPPEWHFPRPRA